MECITDWETFLIDYADEKIFSIYKKGNEDEEGIRYALGDYMIIESIELPDKDVLIGCRPYFEEELEPSKIIEYFKLSEIDLIDRTQPIKEGL